ncbi:MAG: hypothetical protein KHY31_17265 [Clostridiales bacterium]|nr:hypothetical protein [Clostridiales bacterium]
MEHILGYDRWKTSPTDDCLGSCYSCGCTVYAGSGIKDYTGEVWCNDCIRDYRLSEIMQEKRIERARNYMEEEYSDIIRD